MPHQGSARTWIVTVLMFLLSARLAQAGMAHLDCRFPMVFGGAAVNVVVLPYTYAGDSHSLAGTGNRLSLLVKLDVLSHILEYGTDAAIFKDVRKDIEFDEQRKPVACAGERMAVTGIGVREHDDIDSGTSEHHGEATIEMSHAG